MGGLLKKDIIESSPKMAKDCFDIKNFYLRWFHLHAFPVVKIVIQVAISDAKF